jgi:hypothetical protein
MLGTKDSEALALVNAKVAATSVGAALARVACDRAMYLGFVEGSLRLGQLEAAEEWAIKAAECAKAEIILTDIAANPEPYREVAARLRQDRQRADNAVQDEARKEEAKRVRGRAWAAKRALEKARH